MTRLSACRSSPSASRWRVAAGVPLGLLLGTFRHPALLLDPPIMAMYATPQLALLPIFVLWLGIGMSSKIAVVFLGASIPIIVNSMAGVRHVERSLVLAARSFCATRRDVFVKVILPASLPAVMIGIRLGLSRGVLGVVVAEMYVSQDGVGNQIMRLGSAFRVDRLLVYVLLVSTFGLGATTSFTKRKSDSGDEIGTAAPARHPLVRRILVAWEAGARVGWLNPFFTSQPTAIAGALLPQPRSGELARAVR